MLLLFQEINQSWCLWLHSCFSCMRIQRSLLSRILSSQSSFLLQLEFWESYQTTRRFFLLHQLKKEKDKKLKVNYLKNNYQLEKILKKIICEKQKIWKINLFLPPNKEETNPKEKASVIVYKIKVVKIWADRWLSITIFPPINSNKIMDP